jgi:transaldolase
VELFLDSAEIKEIHRWLGYGVLDGVTTNPSILLKDGGFDMESRAREIAEIIKPRPLSVEVYTNDFAEMIKQAENFAEWAPNIVVKIPVINEHGEPCLAVISTLTKRGIKVNMTACLSFGQVVLGAKAGATYISIFAGRVSDEGHDASALIGQSVEWLRRWEYPSRIIVGSMREPMNLQSAAQAGAHIITAPPHTLAKWVDHHYSRATVRGFNQDAIEALTRKPQSPVAEIPNR